MLHHIDDERNGKRLQLGRYAAAHQFASLHRQTMESASESHPHRAVAIDVAQEDVGRVGVVRILQNVVNLAVRQEAHAIDVVHRHDPHPALRIAMHTDGTLLQQLRQPALLVVERSRLQRLQVEHLRAFIERHPQPMESILANAPARIAAEIAARLPHPEVEHRITVVAHQSTTVRGYPHKAVAVSINVVNEVVGQPVRHVEIQDVVPLDILALRPHAQRKNKCQCQQQRPSHIHVVCSSFSSCQVFIRKNTTFREQMQRYSTFFIIFAEEKSFHKDVVPSTK